MSIFQRRIPLDPPELAAMVIGVGVEGPAAQKFAKEYPAIVAVAAFNAAIPANASRIYQRVLAEVSSQAPERKSHMDVFVFANLTGKAAKLAELDRALFEAAAIGQGIRKEDVSQRYDAVLKAAKSPGEALVRKYMELNKKKGPTGDPIIPKNLNPSTDDIAIFVRAVSKAKIKKGSPITALFFLEGVTRHARGTVEEIDYKGANITARFGERLVCWRPENFVETYLQLPSGLRKIASNLKSAVLRLLQRFRSTK